MKQQEFLLENYSSFNLRDIFECGQCFRWNEEAENSYTGVFGNNVINVSKTTKGILFKGVCENDIVNTVIDYFDLDRDYNEIKRILAKVDNNMKESIKYGEGIRILNQDLWETIISFIISANNNIPRIKLIIERISKQYGTKIEFRGRTYYTFPTPKMLENATVQDFRNLGLGFRDKRVYETVQKTLKNEIDLNKLEKEKNIETLRNELLEIPGVGPKVADCVMLFALKKFEVFPVDVWVRRVIAELYFENSEQQPKTIQRFAKEQYGNLAGLAQQYLFYWKRDTA